MGRRVLRRHIWGYSVCLCSIKGTPGLNELSASGTMKGVLISRRKSKLDLVKNVEKMNKILGGRLGGLLVRLI